MSYNHPKLSLDSDPSKWRYLWLQYIDRFNVDEHCLACLVGRREMKVNPRDTAILAALGERPPATGLFYLCGVTFEGWSMNLHVPFRYNPEQTIEVQHPALTGTIQGAEQVAIDPAFIGHRPDLTADPYYRTCRNWQFAMQNVYQGAGRLPLPEGMNVRV